MEIKTMGVMKTATGETGAVVDGGALLKAANELLAKLRDLAGMLSEALAVADRLQAERGEEHPGCEAVSAIALDSGAKEFFGELLGAAKTLAMAMRDSDNAARKACEAAGVPVPPRAEPVKSPTVDFHGHS